MMMKKKKMSLFRALATVFLRSHLSDFLREVVIPGVGQFCLFP
jgi:hypothetical protein